MSGSTTQRSFLESTGRLLLTVSDFGPIRKATVDIRPLTIFVGPTNTGKSYLATLIYALHNLFSSTADHRVDRDTTLHRIPNPLLHRRLVPQPRPLELHDDDIPALVEWIERVAADQRNIPNVFPTSIINMIRTQFEISRRSDELVRNEILRCFGRHDVKKLVRLGGSNFASIQLRSGVDPDSNLNQRFMFDVFLESDQANIRINALRGIPIRTSDVDKPKHNRIAMNTMHKLMEYGIYPDRGGTEQLHDESISDTLTQYIRTIADLMVPNVVGPLHADAYYLTADRTGVMRTYRAMFNSLIGRASRKGLGDSVKAPLLSGTDADFLQALIVLGVDSKHDHRERENAPGRQVESNLLQGSVIVDESNLCPSFHYRPVGVAQNIPMASSSSMVSELTPVVLFLRHMVRTGDLLIVEEPEAHLHPEMQALIACEIARLVNSGVRVLITTHSDLILEQIGNLINVSELPPSERHDLAEPDAVLNSASVGVWRFKNQGLEQGSTVEEAVLDSQTGLYEVGYGTVRRALYNQNAITYNRLQAMNR